MSYFPSADSLRSAEQALRPDQQDDDEQEQRADELELGIDEQCRQLREDSDDERTQDGPPDGAQTAEHDRGEREQEDPETELEVEALRHAQERAGETGQGGASDPD